MKWIKNRFTKSFVFYKIYLINIGLTIIFICIISVICSMFGFQMILHNLVDFNSEWIEEKCTNLDEGVEELNEVIGMLVEDENVFRFLMSSEAYYARATAQLDIIRHFRNVCSNTSLLDAASIVDAQRKIVITQETKMEASDELLRKLQGRNSSFVFQEADGGGELEFVRHFEPIAGERDIYIVLTINQDKFLDNLAGGTLHLKKGGIQFYLLTDDGAILGGEGQAELDSEFRGRLFAQEQEKETWERNGEELLLYKRKTKQSDLSLIAVQNYTYLVKEAGMVKRVAIGTGLLSIAAATVILYLFALYLYRPLKELGNKLLKITEKPQSETKNEYVLIESVVNELQDAKESARPSIIRDSIQKLLVEVFDEERFEQLKRLLYQNMEYEWYIVAVIECENSRQRDGAVQQLESLTQTGKGIEGFVTGLPGKRCAGIFNTCLNYEEFITELEEAWQKIEKKESLYLIGCVSRSFRNCENISLVYSELLSTLEKNMFQRGSGMIYEENSVQQQSQEEMAGQETEKLLVRAVIEGDRERVKELLGALSRKLSSSSANIEYTKYIYFKLCNDLVKNVTELGGMVPKKYHEKALFQLVFANKDIIHLEQLAGEVANVCMNLLVPRDKVFSDNIQKAVGFIAANYMKNLALEDVANAVFLSSGYLSILFKKETGCTVLEYLTRVRMEKAKELVLQVPVLQIKEIAEQLGYNNVQGFIRHFKKYYGVTPMAYRKGL